MASLSVLDQRTAVVSVSGLSIDVPGRRLFESVSLDVAPGEVVALVGPSGSGKTTLLNVMAGIRRPTQGDSLTIAGLDLLGATTAQLSDHRLQHIGLVMQFAELIPELSVVENVGLPLQLTGVRRRPATQAARELLEQLDMSILANSSIESLSGGEAQRVAVCRALIHRPEVILADEPTGSLDALNAAAVCDMLIRTARDFGTAIILTTHDLAIAGRCDRILAAANSALQESDR